MNDNHEKDEKDESGGWKVVDGKWWMESGGWKVVSESSVLGLPTSEMSIGGLYCFQLGNRVDAFLEGCRFVFLSAVR